MQDIMGIINLSEKEDEIKELTYSRPVATVPIAGRYRVVDFVLSNMVNAGIENVSIFTQGKCRSLMEHLGTGREWDLNRKIDGLFVLNPVINISDSMMPKGDIKNFKDHTDYIKNSRQNYVILTRSNMICNINYSDAFKYHKESGVDITIIYKKIEDENTKFLYCDTLNLNQSGNVISIGKNVGNKNSYNISMEMYIMKKNLLLEIIQNSIAMGNFLYLKDAIHHNINNLRVNSYSFNGYLSCINSTENYYKTNMELLDVDISKELFYQNGYIYTKITDEPPTKYTDSSSVENSFIANGCIIEGSVKNSIIGRGVKIEKGAVVKNCVIMQKSIIEENTALKHVVIDKNVRISKNKILCGDIKRPLVIQKNLEL